MIAEIHDLTAEYMAQERRVLQIESIMRNQSFPLTPAQEQFRDNELKQARRILTEYENDLRQITGIFTFKKLTHEKVKSLQALLQH